MECPNCGNEMVMIFYEDDEDRYVHFVCHLCEVRKEELDETGVGMPNEFA